MNGAASLIPGRQVIFHAIADRRRIRVPLKREGHHVNHKKLFRLYREEKLTVRKRGNELSAHMHQCWYR